MRDKPLHLDWCSYKAAEHAVLNWHYSHTMPCGKMTRIGVWEGGIFKGAVLFSRGANSNIGKPYRLNQGEVCELTRVALKDHVAPVTRILAIAIRMLRALCSGLRLVVSYADPKQGHTGGIYQGGGWLYAGRSRAQAEVIVDGRVMHKRTANSLFGTIKGLQKSHMFWKHIYLFPLDPEMKAQIEPLRKPYPKRAGSIVTNAPPIQGGEGGAEPTPALHFLTETAHAEA